MIRNCLAIFGFYVALLWAASALGIGHFALVYGADQKCQQAVKP